MREIKFRAWDKKLKIMSTPFTLLEAFHDYFLLTTDMDVMQYTGIKDPTGKEIYEGDIVKGNRSCSDPKSTEVYVIEWYGGGFDIYLNPTVIGNIYENPELIN